MKTTTIITITIASFMFTTSNLVAQNGYVGINTLDPRKTLEVSGNVNVDGEVEIMTFKNLTNEDASTFLIQDANHEVKTLDVSNPTSAALGYIQEYVIYDPYEDFVRNFDTGINSDDFVMIVISAYYDQDLTLFNEGPGGQSDHYSLPYTYTFIENDTWRIIANYPIARNLDSSIYGTWTVKTLIFSKDLSKQLGTFNIDLSGATTGSAITPIID